MSIAERLTEERKRLGLTQGAFAICGEVSLSSQKRYELAERSPDADYLYSVALVGVDVGYVITGRRTEYSEAVK